jgi:hypothetical protein
MSGDQDFNNSKCWGGSSMRKVILALIGVVVISIPGRSQSYVCYSDTTKPLKSEWGSNCSFTEITANDAFEGTKCLDYTYSQSAYMVHYPDRWSTIDKRFDASKYKYVQFACKINAVKTIPDTLSFWCIHCDANIPNRDLFFNGKFAFTPTTSWQVINVLMSTFEKDPVTMVSSFHFIFSSPGGARHFYVDDIKFSNTEIVGVRPLAQRSITGQVILPKGGIVRIETFALNGAIVASRKVEIAANTAYRALPNATKNLPAGAYVIRQSVVNGEMVSKLDADRLVVVK